MTLVSRQDELVPTNGVRCVPETCEHINHNTANIFMPGVCSIWHCSFHLEWMGETLHIASAEDCFCAVWFDQERFLDIVVHTSGRECNTWEQVTDILYLDEWFSPPLDPEEFEAVKRRATALLESLETKTASAEKERQIMGQESKPEVVTEEAQVAAEDLVLNEIERGVALDEEEVDEDDEDEDGDA